MNKIGGLVLVLLFCGLAISTDVEFGGIYQMQDGGECLTPNRWTGSCSCPLSHSSTCFRAMANEYGTQICFCEPNALVSSGYYGGAYQLDNEEGKCSQGCRVANGFQGSCTCPSGYLPTSVRVLTDTECEGILVESEIIACTKLSGNGNFLGMYQVNQYSECISTNMLARKKECACPVNACSSSFKVTIGDGLTSTISSCTSSLQANPDPSTVDNKVLFGYQGWFSTPADKSVGWFHWSKNSNPPSTTNAEFDVWPDLSEFGADELYPSDLHYSGGVAAGLYNAANPLTVTRHFQWMQTYGLDGVFLQRFVNEIANSNDPHYALRNNVTIAMISAAAATGRVWAIEYDTSGADTNTILETLTNDWKFLVGTLGILNSPQYLHQNGKPVVAVWGFGFTGNPNTQATSLSVINMFKSAGAYVMGGVPYWWRTECCDSQPNFLEVYTAYDLIMPWAVGRYGDPNGFQNLYNTVAAPDIAYLSTRNIGYAPIIFPGFSWANMHNNFSIFNQIPRNGGTFFNAQANTYANHPNVTFIKIAMFDEVDEGTGMFKAAATKADTPVDGTFLYLSIDGTPMTSDAYLCLAGELTAKNG